MNYSPLHIVELALPQQAGYTLRTHAIAKAQRAIGMHAAVAVRPNDEILSSSQVSASGVAVHTCDQVPYFRLTEPQRALRWWILLTQWMQKKDLRGAYRFGRRFQPDEDSFASLLDQLFDESLQPTVIHGHSSHIGARFGLNFARKRGIPFVYEMRGFWEETAASEGLQQIQGGSLEKWREADMQLAKEAEAVITLGQAMREELIERGLPAEKIHVHENCVDSARFELIQKKDLELLQRLELSDKFVAGYVTSVRRLEGIHILLSALRVLRENNLPVAVVIVGDGPELPALKEEAEQLGIKDSVRFVGRVPHHEVWRYYSIMDAFVVPRIDARVCRLVTPLKPLEAMALGVPVVASGLPALQEMIQPAKTGMIFPAEDSGALADSLRQLYKNPDLRIQLREAAHLWVTQERNWNRVATLTQQLYDKVFSKASDPLQVTSERY